MRNFGSLNGLIGGELAVVIRSQVERPLGRAGTALG